MADTQFISHGQVVQPTQLTPRRGMGVFGAFGIVLAILGGALTGGLILLEQSLAESEVAAKQELATLRDDFQINAINQAKSVQNRINRAGQLLNSHVYASQAINFIERSVLDSVQVASFSYANNVVSVDLIAPGYVAYAQQIKYFNDLPEVDALPFPPPNLNENGGVTFSPQITLTSSFIQEKPQTAFGASASVSEFDELLSDDDSFNLGL